MNKIIVKGITIFAAIYGLIMSLKTPLSWSYFTIVSNVFVLIVMCIFIYKDIMEYKGKKIKYGSALYLVKFLSVISILLTGIVYLFILAPFSPGGFIKAYTMLYMGSFCVHFLTPLLCVVDFLLFDLDYKPKKIHALYGIIPPLCYVVFILILGYGFDIDWNGMKAPYNFLNYGAETGWFGFDLSIMSWETYGIGVFYMIVVLSLIFVGLGLLLIKFKKNK